MVLKNTKPEKRAVFLTHLQKGNLFKGSFEKYFVFGISWLTSKMLFCHQCTW